MDYRVYDEVKESGLTEAGGTILLQSGCSGSQHVKRILEFVPKQRGKILAVIQKGQCGDPSHSNHHGGGNYFIHPRYSISS